MLTIFIGVLHTEQEAIHTLYISNGHIAFLGYFPKAFFCHGMLIGSIDGVVVRFIKCDFITVDKSCGYKSNPKYCKGNEKCRHKYRSCILPNFLFEEIVKDHILVICFVIVLFQNIPNRRTLDNQKVNAPNSSG